MPPADPSPVTTVYLLRHAQSHPTYRLPPPEWPLSTRGLEQARGLAALLAPLGIERIFSSPYQRCQQTIAPFLELQASGPAALLEDVRERWISEGILDDFETVWLRSWEDEHYALPGCESSRDARERMLGAIRTLVREHPGRTLAVSTHGNVIGLLLAALDPRCGRLEAEALTNPDVLRLRARGEELGWERDFRLPGLSRIATHHRETPFERGPPADAPRRT